MLQSQKQEIRFRRAALANVGTLVNVLLCMTASRLGFFEIEPTLVLVMSISIWIGHLVFVVAIWRNWNLYFKDASLTVPQMIWVTLSISYLLYCTNELRPLIMMGYLLIMTFGALHLTFKGFLNYGLFTIACYMLVLYGISFQRPETVKIAEEVLLFVSFLFVIAGFVFMGGEFSDLREALNKRHQELKLAISRIEELAITDELTGLYNRRYLMQVLAQHKALANRGHYQFVVCFIDLDHFKKVNDQYGHPFGDKVLIQFSELMNQSLREVDLGARLGGEEFILVLADTTLEDARQVCDRMSKKWMNQKFSEAPDLLLTMSIGVTSYKTAERIEDTLERADQLLYEAKNSGRNCIVVEDQDIQGTLDLV